jgi:hypothetical protein
MTYYVTSANLYNWLNKAQTSLVSKNKVRKELFTDLSEVILFEDAGLCHVVPSTVFLSLQSFLMCEGKDSISNDAMLNWLHSLHDLRVILKKARTTDESELKETVPPSPT